MADFFERFKKSIGLNDDDYEYEEEVYEVAAGDDRFQTTEVEPVQDTNLRPAKSPKKNSNNGSILNFNTKSAMVIAIHEPLSYEEAPKVVDDLKENKAVVLNFEQLDLDVKREIFDFVNGALYAIEGKIQKVNKDIFILAPSNIGIDGLKEELQNSGVFPW